MNQRTLLKRSVLAGAVCVSMAVLGAVPERQPAEWADPLMGTGSSRWMMVPGATVTIQLDDKFYSGKTFIIEVRNNDPENYYIQSAVLNDKPLNTPFIPAKTLQAGGVLILKMGPRPNTSWGI